MSDETDREFWNEAFKENPEEVNVVDHFLHKELKGLEPGSALDLGCGSGLNALSLRSPKGGFASTASLRLDGTGHAKGEAQQAEVVAEQGWPVVGVDWAEHAIELARQEAEKRGLDATFVVADITDWQPPKRFDLVISTYALPGGLNRHPALQTALSPGGTLIVAERGMGLR